MSDTLTLYKLMILYMLDKVVFPLSYRQICDFMLGREYTVYFTLQQALSELEEASLLQKETVRNMSLYQITPDGRNTLEYFGGRISHETREEIKGYLKEHQQELRSEVSTLADFRKTPEGGYLVRCLVKEKNAALIELSLSVPTRQQADSICANWKKKNEEIYSYLMRELL